MKQFLLISVFAIFPFFLFSQHTFTVATTSAGINAGSQDYGQASAWCDIDNDGDLDLAFSYDSGSSFKLFLNNDNSFSDITTSSGLSSISASTIMWAEVNGDEFTDLITQSSLYINNGDNTFSSSGNINNANFNNSLCDFDRDGNIDILTFDPAISIVFGNGDGSFGNTYNFSISGVASSTCFDYNCDGLIDVFFGSSGSSTDKLFENNGDGTFSDVSAGSGLSSGANDVSGIATGDINNDGFPDVYIAAHKGQMDEPGNLLFINNGNGTFSNITVSSGAIGQPSSRTAVFFDYNNDGFLDILVDDHYKGNHLYSNNQDETFSEVAEELDIRDVHVSYDIGGDYFGTSVGDYNNDGASDIFVTGHWSIYRLYENTNCPNNYITVKLKGVESDYNALGSRIKVTCDDFVVYRQVTPAESMNDFYAFPVNIGIGENDYINEIEIQWSSGYVQTINDIEANRILEITEGETPAKISTQENVIIKAFPNPFNNKFHFSISNSNDFKNTSIKIYDISGRLLKTKQINNHSKVISCSLNGIEQKVIIAKVFLDGKEVYSQKLISD